MGAMASEITSLTIVYSTVYSGADHRKHQSSASLAFGHKGPVTRKMLPFDDVIMSLRKRKAVIGDKWYNSNKFYGCESNKYVPKWSPIAKKRSDIKQHVQNLK